MTKNEIIASVMTNKHIAEALKNIFYSKDKRSDLFEDFHSHILLQVCETPYHKLIEAYNGDYLDGLVISMAVFQISQTGSFYRTYLNQGKSNSKVSLLSTDDITELPDQPTDNIDDEILAIYNKVKYHLNHIHWYYAALFKKYHLEGMNTYELSRRTKIDQKAIHRDLKEAERLILEKLTPDEKRIFKQ